MILEFYGKESQVITSPKKEDKPVIKTKSGRKITKAKVVLAKTYYSEVVVVLEPGKNKVKDEDWEKLKEGAWTNKLIKRGLLKAISEKRGGKLSIEEMAPVDQSEAILKLANVEELEELLKSVTNKKVRQIITDRIAELLKESK